MGLQTRFVTMQNHYNLVYREEEREMMPLCVGRDRVIPWSPLRAAFSPAIAARMTSATPRSKTDDFGHKLYYQDSDFKVVDRITEVAKKRGVPNVQIALAWLLQQPGVTSPIIGASTFNNWTNRLAH